MASSQFLIRNRHNNVGYSRIVIPITLRNQFDGKREFRKSLRTSNKNAAKRQALELWVECQRGFEQLKKQSP